MKANIKKNKIIFVPKRVVIAVGGTGGHIFPALSVAEKLVQDKTEVIFMGGGLSQNRLFQDKQYPFHDIACSPYKGIKSSSIFPYGKNLIKGIYQSYRLLFYYQPDIVLGFGSYHSLSPLLAAKIRKIPIILHEANAYPGKVNRLLSPYANWVGVHFIESLPYLKGRVKVVGMPLRSGYRHNLNMKRQALDYFQLDELVPIILISGGSLGSLSMNRIISRVLANEIGKKLPVMQVLHFTGKDKEEDQIRKMYQDAGIKHVVKEFEERMDYALAAADIAISRAGASSIAEQSEYCVPTIFIPYPYAQDNHQEKNADAFISSSHSGIKINEDELTEEVLIQSINKLFQRKEEMMQNIKTYKDMKRHSNLYELVKEMINET